MPAQTTIDSLRKTLAEVLKPENVAAAEAIVATLRKAGASEKEIADALKTFVKPMLAEPPLEDVLIAKGQKARDADRLPDAFKVETYVQKDEHGNEHTKGKVRGGRASFNSIIGANARARKSAPPVDPDEQAARTEKERIRRAVEETIRQADDFDHSRPTKEKR